MNDPTQTAPAPATAAEPSAPVERTLAEFRAEKAAPVVETPAPVAEPARSPLAVVEPPEPPDEPETPVIDPSVAAGAVAELKHKWKSDTGVTLDLRRRDHRKIKRDYEELAALRARVAAPAYQPPQAPPAAQPQARVAQPAAGEPRPTLEQFADEPDPYLAHGEAVARWAAREEFRQAQSQRTAVERTQRTSTAIANAQQAFDAELPKARERYTDFDDAHDELYATLQSVRARGGQARIAPIVHRLLTSEVKHDLDYHLGSHPEDLMRLVNARSPHEQAIELGAIEAQVKLALKAAPPVPPLTPASAPMTPVGAGATPTTYNPETASLATFRAKHGVRGGRRVSA